MRRDLVVGTLLGTLLAAPAAAQQIAEVTLQEAVQRALQVQPAMVQARGDQSNASASMRASIGSYLPTISTNGSSQRNGGTRFNSTTGQIVTAPASTSFNGGLSANIELFDGFRRLADVRSSHAAQNAAAAGVSNQLFQVTLQTKQAFYNALATSDLVRVAESQVTRAQQQLRISIDKLHAGSATRSDSFARSLITGTRASRYSRRKQISRLRRRIWGSRSESMDRSGRCRTPRCPPFPTPPRSASSSWPMLPRCNRRMRRRGWPEPRWA